ncbi:hypothetical protein [uncultured Flavonifractor sp.]|uniref:hypothetical protein n=1 Tax=uncultured Flavonifractor sp. TaxID=1193534 RepID=UPI002592AF48|nr:hypothetical protein [uncultured Flavonifractor sp.]
MNGTLYAAMETEHALKAILEELKRDVVQKIRTAPPLAGVQPAEWGGVRGAVVSASAIFGSRSVDLSPGYYLQDVQADIVGATIAPCQTVSEVVVRLEAMAESGKAAHRNYAGTRLNERTIFVLREFCQ